MAIIALLVSISQLTLSITYTTAWRCLCPCWAKQPTDGACGRLVGDLSWGEFLKRMFVKPLWPNALLVLDADSKIEFPRTLNPLSGWDDQQWSKLHQTNCADLQLPWNTIPISKMFEFLKYSRIYIYIYIYVSSLHGLQLHWAWLRCACCV